MEEATRDVPFGPFVLLRRIAVGGSAEVFLARPKIGNRPASQLIVKRLLKANRDPDQFDLLEREAELHRTVSHPNVVTVFGAGMVGDEPYLAMEYVHGVDLYRLLRYVEADAKPLTPSVAVHIARGVAAALQAVHTATNEHGTPLGIVHRDVTPSNVYLSTDGDVKLGDFGIARVSETVRAPSHQPGLKGKFAYLSPEQIAGETFDNRSDLFALSVVLGEMLIGERIFPGVGQLAVLLAIRDVNIEPFRAKAKLLPQALVALCERGLARDPEDRFPDAAAFAEALAPFETPSPETLRAELASLVSTAFDPKRFAERVQSKVRDSVERMRAVRIQSKHPSVPRVPSPQVDSLVQVERADGSRIDGVAFSRLLEMIATGDLGAEDRVALWGSEPKRIREIEDLARHLLPSTTATTSRLFSPGVPDYQALLRETNMLEVLARMRRGRETGALFVERRDQTGEAQRKELYLADGRLLYVASSDRAELLGEYLVRRGQLTREQLEGTLAVISGSGGRLGDTLIALGHVEAVYVFRAIRDQGRDRVAALCAWPRGSVTFYRGPQPSHVEFPLDLDLASPMMAGAIIKSHGTPRDLLPADGVPLEPGPRHVATPSPEELGSAPASLRAIPRLAQERVSVGEAIDRLTSLRPGGRVVSHKEACAALVAARALGWVEV